MNTRVVVLLAGAIAALVSGLEGRAPDRNHQAHAEAAESPAVTVAFDGNSTLWRLALSNGRLYLDQSTDRGKSFAGRMAVTGADEKVSTGTETRPRLSLGSNGQKWVTYERSRGRTYSGDVIVRRAESGQSFSDPVVVNDNREEIGHSFHTSATSPSGDLYVAWLDDRGGNSITEGGGRAKARGLYCAVLPAAGRLTTPVNRSIALDRVCDCCRPALAFTAPSEAVLFVRLATADGLRDHGSFRLGPAGLIGAVRPGPRDEWRLDGCPHHGPALAIDGLGRYHAVWFTGSERRQGLFYAASPDGGRTYSDAVPVGNALQRAGHPDVITDGSSRVWVTWTERMAGVSRVFVKSSTDGGKAWSVARQLAEASGGVDYAFLHRSKGHVFVSWSTIKSGLQVLPVD